MRALDTNEREFVREITPRAQDYSQWYVDVVRKAELMDYAPIKGCMVIRPAGYAIWERIREALDARFKATGHVNAYFPIFIPQSLLAKEAEHVEGFAPEVAWVTKGGQEDLTEWLAVRPTSETIICAMYAKWIQSYRDLPVLINQWANVVRWEKVTRPFLRTTEFLWQEGHTCHATEAEAEAETLRMLDTYAEFARTELAIPMIVGRKTEGEKFAGALRTYAIEALMSDGRALQAGTSHNLGQHFAKVFDIQFLDRDGQLKHVWQTSWGVSTRLIGALIMVHSDDRGLVLPPRVAPLQAVVVPISPAKDRAEVVERARGLTQALATRASVKLDDREEYTPGWKYNEWEMRGVPVRVELGPRDLKAGQCVMVRRDTGEKAAVPLDGAAAALGGLLEQIQAGLLERAQQFQRDNTVDATTYAELAEAAAERKGLIRAGWCGGAGCEARVKEETGATIRCLPFDLQGQTAPCVICGRSRGPLVYFARAY